MPSVVRLCVELDQVSLCHSLQANLTLFGFLSVVVAGHHLVINLELPLDEVRQVSDFNGHVFQLQEKNLAIQIQFHSDVVLQTIVLVVDVNFIGTLAVRDVLERLQEYLSIPSQAAEVFDVKVCAIIKMIRNRGRDLYCSRSLSWLRSKCLVIYSWPLGHLGSVLGCVGLARLRKPSLEVQIPVLFLLEGHLALVELTPF